MNRIQTIQTPTGPLSVILPVAQQLLKQGVISGTLDGALHAADAATVKAAIMAHGVCDFCSAPGPTAYFDVPDFDMPMTKNRSTGGWATCDTCADLIRKGQKKALLDRSVENMAFPKFSRHAIGELHERFWEGMDGLAKAKGMVNGIADFVEDRLPPAVTVTLTDRDKRIEAIARVSGLLRTELELIIAGAPITGELAAKMLAWRKKFGGNVDTRQLADLFAPTKRPLANLVPHWQAALDGKFEVAATLRKYLDAGGSKSEFFDEALDLENADAIKDVVKIAAARQSLKSLGFGVDLKLLPGAQAYSFNADTEAAIMEASMSIPHDAPLSSIEPPNAGAGWFWFSDPLPFAASPIASDHTHALLWGWVNHSNNPMQSKSAWTEGAALIFSAYVRDEKGGPMDGKLMPSTRWFWPLSMTFNEMLAFNADSWKKTYGPGTAMEHDKMIMGEPETMKVIAGLSLFFIMSCVWFRQTVPGEPKKKINPILTTEPGHVERHARKRYEREFKLDEKPSVKVVALRRSVRTDAGDAPAERKEGARNYHCRWIVQGHPRMQACGPGRKDRKLIWIDAHPAGPENMPLKTSTTVYAVIR